ncbi:hypothetical protein N8751_01315, partial [bacterium]|nr:hypothetical protein [bacterium]
IYLEMDVKLDVTLDSIDEIVVDNTASGGSITTYTSGFTVTNISKAGLTDDIKLIGSVATGSGINLQAAAANVSANDLNNYPNIDDRVNNSSLKSTHAAAIPGSNRIGQRAIEYVEVEIGGQCIDKQYGDWMDIWAGLTYDNEKWSKWNRIVNGTLSSNSSGNKKLYIPLQFWFCRNPGLALPLIALQYHEVKLNVQFASSVTWTHQRDLFSGTSRITAINTGPTLTNNGDFMITGDNGSDIEFVTGTTKTVMSIENCCVFCDYIFLDTDERRRFAQVSHEYLIEQVQYSNALTLASGEDQHELRFNHPVKELVWAAQTGTNAGNNFNYFNGTGDMIKTALLQLNGHDRMKKREGSYFRCVQPYQHHTGADGQSNTDEWGGYYCYSFGLKPEEHQPSGTCNFSRIDNAVLTINGSSTGTLKVWAVNYNVLRIMSGMGGLAYSN